MRRTMAAAAVAVLCLAACGGDDDGGDAADGEAAETVDEPTDDDAADGDAADDDAADDAADGDAADDDAADDAAGDDGNDDDAADDDEAADDGDDAAADDDGSGRTIRSIGDIPQECRDQMATFLDEIEPIVEPIDWQTATLAEFEAIADDFEAISDEFEAANQANGCDDLVFADDDDEFDLLIDFAGDEAPGTIGFLEFISDFAGAADDMVAGAGGETGDGDAGGGSEITDCDGAVAFVEEMMSEYDSYLEVPAAQLMEFGSLGMVLTTCTPEQLELFDSDEFNTFFGE